MEDFVADIYAVITIAVITMQTKTGKTLYLKEGIGKAFEWTFDRSEAIWFETIEEAEKFANKYFKNFKDYKIKEMI